MKWDVATNKKIRRSTWYTTAPCRNSKTYQAHAWCVEYDSIGGFYHHYTNTRWWFERAEDATIFALKFNG